MLLVFLLFSVSSHATDRLEQNVVVTLEPTSKASGTLEFVGCSKACHESETTHEDLPDSERLIPADRYTVETDGTWPAQTQFSMRDDLYYFALFGPKNSPPEDRRFSLRKHASDEVPIRFEIGATLISEQKNARAMPAPPLPEVAVAVSEPATAQNANQSRLVPLSAPPPPNASPLKLPLGFLMACGLGGLLGWALVRRSP